MTKPSIIPCIYVLAGSNGAGMSSVLGEIFLEKGIEFLNPDKAARRILSANPGMSQDDANSAAWHQGVRLLERTIEEGLDSIAFETTLGGKTITSLLTAALSKGIEVRISYVGLSSVELHIARVRSRVAEGGHDIPEERIRERYASSRLNLIQLLPKLTELLLYDNSEEADPRIGTIPMPKLILRVVQGKVLDSCDLTSVPEWAKPIFAVAIHDESK